MEIEVNGKFRDLEPGQSVAALLTELELDGLLVVVELNRQIVRHTERTVMILNDGDRVEIVHFVGGG
jgi:thiamine biosynthesis protein ThiS